MDPNTVLNLLKLSRLAISNEEKDQLTHDLAGILSYVEQIERLPNEIFQESHMAVNILRDDEVTNVSGAYTEVLIKEMPDSEHGYLKVKQIL